MAIGDVFSMQGQVLTAVTNAVLALYGEPEPEGRTSLKDVVDLLNRLAAERRDDDW